MFIINRVKCKFKRVDLDCVVDEINGFRDTDPRTFPVNVAESQSERFTFTQSRVKEEHSKQSHIQIVIHHADAASDRADFILRRRASFF